MILKKGNIYYINAACDKLIIHKHAYYALYIIMLMFSDCIFHAVVLAQMSASAPA
jgi:hypothetical protein